MKRSFLVLGTAVLLATTGCGKKPAGQTVAVVNGEEITASELNAELAAASLPQGVDKKAATNQALQSIVDRRLLVAKAKGEGLDRSPDYITRQRRQNEDLLLAMLANRQMESGKLPGDAEINAIQTQRPQSFATRELWQLRQIVFASPADKALQAKIAASKSLDELAATLTAAGLSFTRATNQVATDMIPPDIYPKLQALPAGAIFLVPNGPRSVASAIVAREPAPLTGPAARAAAAQIIRRESSAKTLQQQLKDMRASAKIEYKEGFGPAR